MHDIFAFIEIHVVHFSCSKRLSWKSERRVEIFDVVHQRSYVELSSSYYDIIGIFFVREPLRHYASEYEVEVIDRVGKVYRRSFRMVHRIGTVDSVRVNRRSAAPMVENAFFLSCHSRFDEKKSRFGIRIHVQLERDLSYGSCRNFISEGSPVIPLHEHF